MFIHDTTTFAMPKIQQCNLPGGRVYIVEGIEKKYRSITSVLGAKPKPALNAWRKRVGHEEAARITADSAARGKALHSASEDYLKNKPITTLTSPIVKELWTYLKPWIDEHVEVVYGQEIGVYSDILGAAGQFDLLARVDGEYAIVDFKNSRREKKLEWVKDYFLQVSFYAACIYELTGIAVKKGYIPVVHPEGLQEFDVDPYSNLQELYTRIREGIRFLDSQSLA